MCTIVIEAETPFNRTSRIKCIKLIARSQLFCRIAKSSMQKLLTNRENLQKATHNFMFSCKSISYIYTKTISTSVKISPKKREIESIT